MLRLYNGDCLEVMKDISSNSIDLVICDLPFGCLARSSIGKAAEEKKAFSGDASGCQWDIKIDLEAFWKEIKRIRRNEHTPCLHFTTVKYGFDLYNSNPKDFRYDLVWDKGRGVSFLQANKMPMRSHEMIYVFSKEGAYYNRIDISGDYPNSLVSKKVMTRKDILGTQVPKIIKDNTGKRCMKSVINHIDKYTNSRTDKPHPTEKPEELYRFLIERYCPVGGTVLDPTFGSGNSGKAAKELGRKYIGIEKDKGFFEKAKEILEK